MSTHVLNAAFAEHPFAPDPAVVEAYETAHDVLVAARAEYNRLFAFPVIGLFVSMSAWRRLQAAQAAFVVETNRYIEALQAVQKECLKAQTALHAQKDMPLA